MRVCFRVDASLEIGSGHVMRCLTLAHELRGSGADTTFISRLHPGNLRALIQKNGFNLIDLPEVSSSAMDSVGGAPNPPHARWLGVNWELDARQCMESIADLSPDWLVVDHYALDSRWETALRPYCQRIMVIDDLADRSHDCDILLDQNLERSAQHYTLKVPKPCKLLLGPQYALLRKEFAANRERSLARRATPEVRQLMVSLGGVDKENATTLVLDALREANLPPDCQIIVVLGAMAPFLPDVRAKAAAMPRATEVLVDVTNMAEVMADSDLAIGAAGSTSWERCCLGLPAAVAILADNQRDIAHALHGRGAAICIGSPVQEGFSKRLGDLVAAMIRDKELLSRTSGIASSVADGLGASRVAAILRS